MGLSLSDIKRLGIKVPGHILAELEEEKENKYHNRKAEVDGIVFASEKEANKYCELKLLKKAGLVKDFQCQVPYVLQDKYSSNGKRIRAIKYIADFVVDENDGTTTVIDTKGYRTKEYLLKKKMFLKRYPDIKFVEE